MKLTLENLADLEWGLRHNDGVVELWVGAVLVGQVGLERILQSFEQFPELNRVRVADDYLRDDKIIQAFENTMKKRFPGIVFSWTYDLKVDGKYGR